MSIDSVSESELPARLVRKASGGVAFAGLCLAGFGMTAYEPLDDYPWRILAYGAAVGFALLLLLFGTALAIGRFNPRAPAVRALLVPWPAGALLLVGCGLVATLNGALSLQAPQAYETVVVHRDQRESGNKAAWFEVADFRAGHQGEQLTVSPDGLFDLVSEGDRIVVVAGRGFAAWWIEEIRLPEPSRRAPSDPSP